MAERWGGLRLGDLVVPIARTRRMIIVDLDLDDPREVTCSWQVRFSDGRRAIRERVYRTSALVFAGRSFRA